MEEYVFSKQKQWDDLTTGWENSAHHKLIIIGEDYKRMVDEYWNLHRLMQGTTSMIDWQNRQRCNAIVYEILNSEL